MLVEEDNWHMFFVFNLTLNKYADKGLICNGTFTKFGPVMQAKMIEQFFTDSKNPGQGYVRLGNAHNHLKYCLDTFPNYAFEIREYKLTLANTYAYNKETGGIAIASSNSKYLSK